MTLRQRIIKSYHRTRDAKTIAKEFDVEPVYVRQIAKTLRGMGHDIPLYKKTKAGDEKFVVRKGYLQKYRFDGVNWKYVRKPYN